MMTPDDILEIEKKGPIHITVYYAAGCPLCPKVIASLEALAAKCLNIRLKKVNAGINMAEAEEKGVQSVPTTFYEDRFRWVGAFDISEIIEMIRDPDLSQMSKDTMKNMLGAGDAEKLADAMGSAGQLFPVFLELVIHEKWPVRLGAMVTIEYLMQRYPFLAESALEKLWEVFWDQKDEVQGDLIYLFGLWDSGNAKGYLEAIIKRSLSDEIQKAAREALDID